jgi:hypothetical protein
LWNRNYLPFVRAFNFTYRYIDDVLSINNSRFAEYLPLIYPPEIEVKETTDSASSASFFSAETMISNAFLYSENKDKEVNKNVKNIFFINV